MLEQSGNLVNTEDYVHNVAKCERCKTTIEPKVSMQWFVSMKDLAKRAADAVRNDETKFIPKRYEKQYFHWLDNIQDWCISRQLWWGHRIPAYYCDECGNINVAKEFLLEMGFQEKTHTQVSLPGGYNEKYLCMFENGKRRGAEPPVVVIGETDGIIKLYNSRSYYCRDIPALFYKIIKDLEVNNYLEIV